MKMEKLKILVYCWDGVTEKPLCRALEHMGIEMAVYTGKMKDYHADSDFTINFLKILHRENATCVFSYNYFPLVSMLCEVNQIPYIAWIYDCPLLTIYSRTVTSPFNYIFSFDELLTQKLIALGGKHCYSLPLAGEVGDAGRETAIEYTCDISFVGSLYNDAKNRVRNSTFSDFTVGFIDGIVEAQTLIYGYSFIRECLSEDVIGEIVDKCHLHLNDKMFIQDEAQLAADAIGMEVTAREREKILQCIGKQREIYFYTGSAIPSKLQIPGIKVCGRIDYEGEMPRVFRESRINLNITSCTIASGIPLRVFDILSAGGFCLTNYRPEMETYFEDGVDLVMFSDADDMVQKIEYYLVHEEERQMIAMHGQQTVKKHHTFEQRIQTMIDIVFGNSEVS